MACQNVIADPGIRAWSGSKVDYTKAIEDRHTHVPSCFPAVFQHASETIPKSCARDSRVPKSDRDARPVTNGVITVRTCLLAYMSTKLPNAVACVNVN